MFNEEKTTLIVEDEPVIALAESSTLRQYGYGVITAMTAKEAIALVDSRPEIDLILMDIDLGSGMDGTEAASIILSRHTIPIIFLSSHTEREIVEKTEGITSYGYIVKNTGETVLVASIKMAFRLFESRMKEQEKDAAIAEKEHHLQSISNNLVNAMIYQAIAMPNGFRKITYLSDVVRDFYGISPEEGLADANLIYSRIHPEDRERLYQEEESALSTMSVFRCEARMLDPKGEMRWSLFVSSPTIRRDGSVCWNGIEFDITERKQIENTLQEEYQKSKEILNSIPSGLFIYRYEAPDRLILVDGNSEADRLTGVRYAEWIGREFNEIWPNAFKQGITKKYLDVAHTGKNLEIEDVYYRDERVDGAYRIRVFPIPGEKIGVAFENITDIINAENEIRKLLEEKTTLLKEVHHRIRNNISSIESLMTLQYNAATNEHVRSALNDAIGRVSSMRVLYENLLVTDNYRDISAREYIAGLISALTQLFPDNDNITIRSAIDDFTLSSKIMNPLGIIANEIITNAFKHAFQGKTRGTIDVTMQKEGSKVSLVIQDNGIGILDEVMAGKSTGFGLTIVGMLARQIDASYTLERSSGTICRIECIA